MRFEIRHELPDRIRFSLIEARGREAPVERAVSEVRGVYSAAASRTTGSLVVRYDGRPAARRKVVAALARLDPPPEAEPGAGASGSAARAAGMYLLGRLLPQAARAALSSYAALPFLVAGLRSLRAGRLDSQVLDAAAIGTALRMGDYGAASTITTLLRVGDELRDRTEARARGGLATRLGEGARVVWAMRDGRERRLRSRDLLAGDVVVVRAGHVIPVDGRVVSGRASVDQSTLTGEAAPVARGNGASVYAGTIVIEGRIDVEAVKVGAETRRARIIAMVEEGSATKAAAERRADRLADSLTPYIFSVAGLTRLLTGDPVRAASVLLVDYSCALRLSVPMAIKAAMIEGVRHGLVIRGGRALEALAEADTFVFDKTGTLTSATPRVVDVLPARGSSAGELLRAAACVEEHFPHPVGSAILREAARRGVTHRDELHGEVRCEVGRGVVSTVEGRRFLVGSRRMLQGEGIAFDGCPEEREGCSMVFVASDGRLAGAFVLDDPPRPEVPQVVAALRAAGARRLVLLTGDSRANARRVAALGFDEWHAELSPEEKAEIVQRLKGGSGRVAMVGDGMNDAPALAVADIGISFQHGTDIARETADILIMRPELNAVPMSVELARLAMDRVGRNFRGVVGVNSALIAGAALGCSSPAKSALAHNAATLLVSARSMAPYLPERRTVS